MIGLLIVAHGKLGESLIQAATFVLGQRPEQLAALDLMAFGQPETMFEETQRLINALDDGQGVLILADLFGSTPCNTICKQLQTERVAAVAGINLPMLLKAATSRTLPLAQLTEEVVRSGHNSVFTLETCTCDDPSSLS